MPTFLFDKIIFGPVRSRRLGNSLGINLLPSTGKLCNFNCIYCECGWTGNLNTSHEKLPTRQEVYHALDHKLERMKENNNPPDVITFAGNGEPTLHPEFPGIIDDCIELRDKYFPDTRIAVLSNSTTITRPGIKEALLKVDQNILKLDSAFDLTVKIHNQPRVNIRVNGLVEDLKNLKGQLIIQTMFVRGTISGNIVDNTTEEELDAWLRALKTINPSEVMIYTISRDTPDGSILKKVPASELKRIAEMVNNLGIKTQVSA